MRLYKGPLVSRGLRVVAVVFLKGANRENEICNVLWTISF